MKKRHLFSVYSVIIFLVTFCYAGDVRVIAHRGFSSVAPENTMAAFQAAADLGVCFELDVTLSADGVPVILHDDTLGRSTSGKGDIGDFTLEEIKALDAGSWFDKKFTGEQIPTLREVLEKFGGKVPIDIEIKDRKPLEPLVDAVLTEIERLNLEDDVFITAFNPYMLVRAKNENPVLLRGMLTGTFKDDDLTVVEKFVLKHMLFRGKVKPRYIAIEKVRITKHKVKKWHRKRFEVLAWTVNDESEMLRLINIGVDGIITDYPDKLSRILAEKE